MKPPRPKASTPSTQRRKQRKPLPKVELVPAERRQQPIVANLLELYIHDFSEFLPVHLGPDGKFGYPELPLYWSAPGRHPFLIKVDGHWAGLVLVKQQLVKQERASSTDQPTWDIAEFFIARAYRRLGIGTGVAQQIWRKFPGPWTVRVMKVNHAALPFWEHAISGFTGNAIEPSSFERNGQFWALFSFFSQPR